MTLTLEDLDGTWRITTVTDYNGPVPMQSDGETVISGGETDRVDRKGCRWNTRLRVLSDTAVAFESIADPSDADSDFCLTAASGELTRDPVTYAAVLSVARKGDKIRLSGQIAHGKTVTVITMIKA